jgi:hypothetical protein
VIERNEELGKEEERLYDDIRERVWKKNSKDLYFLDWLE